MRCPVCESEVFEYHAICPVCNYFGLHKDFANDDEASAWERYVLKYYRALWIRKKQKTVPTVDLESKEAIAIFQKYFSDESHKYRLYSDSIKIDYEKRDWAYDTNLSSAKAFEQLGNNEPLVSVPPDLVTHAIDWNAQFTGIEINTKILNIGFMQNHNVNPQFFWDYGHEYYWIEYLVEENVVSIFLVPKREDGLKDYLCSIQCTDTTQKNELAIVLEFLKCGDTPFSTPFNESVHCLDNFRDYDLTYDTYFRDTPIKPLVFYAEVTDYCEDDEKVILDHGLCKVIIKVEGSGNKPAPKFEKLYVDENPYRLHEELIRILKPNEGFGYHQWGYLRENEPCYDYYLDRKQKLLFSGTSRKYRKYKFEDELLMQQVFNYMVILGTYWLM